MRFTVYRDAKREWRWRLRARNGRIIADSAEGYKTEGAAMDRVLVIMAEAASAEYVVTKPKKAKA
jgi:uncharacterized protein YegP (UPF0339 family)